MTKTCTACGLTKPLAEFHPRKDPRSVGVVLSTRPQCKTCIRSKAAAWERNRRQEALNGSAPPKSVKPVQVEKVGCVAGGCPRVPPPITLPVLACVARIDAKWPDIVETVRRQRRA